MPCTAVDTYKRFAGKLPFSRPTFYLQVFLYIVFFVNVYCTTATGCKPNCSYIYIYIYIYHIYEITLHQAARLHIPKDRNLNTTKEYLIVTSSL
jgi:hypothetical protein